MHIHSLQKKRICILGFGREGQATLRAIKKYAPEADITVADRDEASQTRCQVSGVRCQVGTEYLRNLNQYDIVIKSPGIPPSTLETHNLTPKTYHLTNATQIFLDSIAGSGVTVIGVTGSKGKSTTASLIYEILKKASCHPEKNSSHHDTSTTSSIYLIGNIGSPALDFLDKAKPGVTFVMESSSYQLADLTTSPPIAVITSFFPEHLDYHGSLEAYKEAKRNICRFQRETDIVFYSSQALPPHPALSRRERMERVHASVDDGTYEIARISPGKKIPFSERDAPINLSETRLIGTHNLRNIAAAWKVAEHLGIPHDCAIQAIQEFQPLPHRLQSLGIYHGIEWIDDAISTTPESTIAALDALGDRVSTIILGGLDRGFNFTALAERLTHSNIQTIILFPGSGPRIRQAIEEIGNRTVARNVEFCEASSMAEAIRIAKKRSNLTPNTYPSASSSGPRGNLTPICLLSTASPSYNMFKNFEEKGDYFQREIYTITTSPPYPNIR